MADTTLADLDKIVTRDYLVTVCDECLCASCWHGEIMCQDAYLARTRRMKASELNRLNKEHPSYYRPTRLLKICGGLTYAD